MARHSRVGPPLQPVAEGLLQSIDTFLKSRFESEKDLEEFLTKRIKIRDLDDKITMLRPNKLQLLHKRKKEEAIAKGRSKRFLLLKSRRMGFTTFEQATSYRATSTRPNSSCITLADNGANTKVIFRMVLLMARLDPRQPKGLEESQSHIGYSSLNTNFRVGTAGQKAVGRGDNLFRAHGSEVAHWPGKIEEIENLIAGITEAAKKGEVVLETTANGAEGWFYEKYCEAMKDPESEWTPLFYPWFWDEDNYIFPTSDLTERFYDTITTEEKLSMEKYELSLGQMLWRRRKKNALKKLFKQEYPENWTEAFIVRGSTFFDPETLDEISQNVKSPLNSRENVVIWKEPEKGRSYCAGADVSEGNQDSDNCVCGILDKETGEQVAVLRGKWRPEVFARKCVELCKHYNNAVFACEINNHGHSVMNTVMNNLNYKHLYYRRKPLDKNKFGRDKIEQVPGWNTNGKTRPLLLDELNEALEETYMIVNDTVFINECKVFVDDGGKYQADSGKYDDSIFAWGIAWQARKQKRRSFIA